MPVNPQVAALLEMMRQAPPVDYATITPEAMRAQFDVPMQMGPPPAVARVEPVSIALDSRTLDARLYVPEGAGDEPLPLTVYYHGGGWVLCTLDTHDGTCRMLARESGCAVLSVAYRLAPENPYPVPFDDCYEALLWAAAHAAELGCDPARLAVAGDSAGGNLAAACAIAARDRGGPALRHQLLIYPVTDCDYSFASYAENGGGDYFLGQAGMEWFWTHYLSGRALADAPMATILKTADLSALPPATVVVAEFDPLRDEGLAYAQRLADAGVAVEQWVAPGMIHGFFGMFEAVPDAVAPISRAGKALGAGLRGAAG